MRPVWAVAVKDIRLLLRDPAGFFFAFFFPLFYCIFFGAVFAGWGNHALHDRHDRAADEPREMPTSMVGSMKAGQEVEADAESAARPRTQYDLLYPQALMWGVLGCAATFSIAFVVERTGGTLERLRMAPLGSLRIAAGKAIACFVTILCLMAALTVAAVVLFGVAPGSYVNLLLAAVAAAFAFVGVMTLLATLPSTERAAGGISWAILMTMAMLGGGVVPLYMMPNWLARVALASPVRWSIRAIEGAVWRGDSIPELLPAIGVLVGIGLAGIAAGGVILHLRTTR